METFRHSRRLTAAERQTPPGGLVAYRDRQTEPISGGCGDDALPNDAPWRSHGSYAAALLAQSKGTAADHRNSQRPWRRQAHHLHPGSDMRPDLVTYKWDNPWHPGPGHQTWAGPSLRKARTQPWRRFPTAHGILLRICAASSTARLFSKHFGQVGFSARRRREWALMFR